MKAGWGKRWAEEGPGAFEPRVEVPKLQLVFSGTKSSLKKISISRRLGDVNPQGPNKLPAVCRPGPAGAGGRLSGAVGWDGFGVILYLDFPVIGVIHSKNLAVVFAKWKTGLLENCEGSQVLVITQGLMFGCLMGLWLTEF